MTALWLDAENNTQRLDRVPRSESGRERWLQEQLFNHPELVPFDDIEHGAGGFIPIIQELRLDGNVRLDVLGVTPHGRFCQNSGLRVEKASDLAFLAPAPRFETEQLLLTFMAEIGVEP